nr:nucleotide pyrophosphatase/phosphodiesterase family protein [Zhihengliuella flava]
MPSAAAVLGVPGVENVLGLPAARRVCVVMVDGLGSSLLKSRGAHAPFLRRAMQQNNQTLDAAFPTTTASSLASFGTGLAPGEHGLVGYDVVDPASRRVVNQLGNWPGWLDPRVWQPKPTVLQRAADVVSTTTVSLPAFADSQLTAAALRGGSFVGAKTLQARVQAAQQALAGSERSLVYLYINELDKAGHRHGAASVEWGEQLEELDFALRSLVARLPASTLVLVTADHGMVDVPASRRIDYSQRSHLIDGVELTAGEPRAVQLHLAAGVEPEEVARRWRAEFGAGVWVMTRETMIQQGYFGPRIREDVTERIGDVLIMGREPELALYDGRRVAPHAFEMVGQHGSLTRAERQVPLIEVART